MLLLVCEAPVSLMNSAACVATLTLMRWPGYLDVPKVRLCVDLRHGARLQHIFPLCQVLFTLRDSKSNVTWLNPGMLVEVVRHPITNSMLPPGSFPDLKLLIVAYV